MMANVMPSDLTAFQSMLPWNFETSMPRAVMDADEFLNGGSAYREMTFAE